MNVVNGKDFAYQPRSLSLRISQPLFDLERWAAYQEGDVRSARAEVVFADARQDLIQRLAGAYFNYFLANDTLELAQAQHAALGSQRVQVENLFKSGIAVLTDVEETKARQQLAQAQELSSQSALELRRKELGKIVGELPPRSLPARAVVPVLTPPEPGVMESWVDVARTQNLKVLAQRLAVDMAGHQLTRSRAPYLPTVSLVASRQRLDNPNYFTDKEATAEVGVQLSMNLFDGGGTTARMRQAVAQREKARQDLESLTRDAEIKASQAYLEIINGINQINALEQAVKSAETTLQGMEIGQKAGLRTNSDVLNAQQQLFSARRDLQKERYGYLINRLALQAAVGTLDEKEVEAIDRLSGIPRQP